MIRNIKIFIIFSAVLLIFFAFTGEKPKAQTDKRETAAQKFKNIRALREMPADEMGKVMNIMSASLGVSCNYCHTSNSSDFEKDDNKNKRIAREMIEMTFFLNKKYFKNRPEISCNTCHRGRLLPASEPDLSQHFAAEAPEKFKAPPPPGIEQILANYEKALGGKENLAKIKSRKIKAIRIEPDGKTFEEEEILQKAGRLKVTTRYGDFVVTEAFDGARAWKRAGSGEIELKADEAEQIEREAGLFANPGLEKIYAKTKFLETALIEGRETYVISAVTKDEKSEKLYFDARTGFLIRRTASAPTVLGSFVYQVDYRDYKNFGGVRLPVITRFAVPNISWTRKILEVNNNAPFENSVFDLK